MDKIIRYLIAVIAILLCAAGLQANIPTVTQTLTYNGKHLKVYEITFSTGISTVDSVFIGGNSSDDRNVSFFDLSNLGISSQDSIVFFEMHTTETTADSTRLTILHQMTLDKNPASTDWITVATDATSFTNTLTALVSFKPKLYGLPWRYRAVVYENNTSKDATQTFTIRVAVPE